jgi:hypothetical protein
MDFANEMRECRVVQLTVFCIMNIFASSIMSFHMQGVMSNGIMAYQVR